MQNKRFKEKAIRKIKCINDNKLTDWHIIFSVRRVDRFLYYFIIIILVLPNFSGMDVHFSFTLFSATILTYKNWLRTVNFHDLINIEKMGEKRFIFLHFIGPNHHFCIFIRVGMQMGYCVFLWRWRMPINNEKSVE